MRKVDDGPLIQRARAILQFNHEKSVRSAILEAIEQLSWPGDRDTVLRRIQHKWTVMKIQPRMSPRARPRKAG